MVSSSSQHQQHLSYPQHVDPPSIGPLHFILFAQTHHDFRLADFHSAAQYYSIQYAFVPAPCDPEVPSTPSYVGSLPVLTPPRPGQEDVWLPDVTRAIMLVHLPDDAAALLLASRVSSIRSIWSHWCSSTSYPDLSARAAAPDVMPMWERYRTEPITWKAAVRAVNHTITQDRQKRTVEMFSWMGFVGHIKLKDPQLVWGIWEEYMYAPRSQLLPVSDDHTDDRDGPLTVGKQCGQIWMGRLICEGQAREWVPRLSLKERVYIGNTSMESEMSLIMASMALAGPGKLVYDPFAGTGSMLIAAAAMGAYVLGSDIDGRMMRGKKTGPKEKIGVLRSAEQYGLGQHLLDCAVFDMTQHPWRRGGILDAIVADPPYGVRAGARRIGRRDETLHRTAPVLLPHGVWAHEASDWVPPTRPYHLQTLLVDLLSFSAYLLKKDGRLVFWMPIGFDEAETTADGEGGVLDGKDNTEVPISEHFELVANSLQSYGRWGRRLITLRKVSSDVANADPLAWRTASKVYKDNLERRNSCTSRSCGAQATTPAAQGSTEASAADQTHSLSNTGLSAQLADSRLDFGRRRATDDPDEFRNKYFKSRSSTAAAISTSTGGSGASTRAP